ncbi:mediator of RNA polymerase II transcription subunit 9-like isoform X2 [Phragmites australis]|uniref:mediator of RNA polymerase II transcription subunit 9-like isoform X2 n=1 Tax=Phragmites australis TaxID=29695 RepID=UPI002D78CE97|nr:mediator of RNA polymerase II transcription subunit 9-like isoform X2 [Phragmites australis]
MDNHHPQQPKQQYGDPYRALVPSPQPDHHLHALQYHHQPQPTLMSPPQPQQHHHASLASHFHLLHLVTRLADAIGTGTRDQNFDALVEELTSQFARCQQLLNSISGTISSKSTLRDKGRVWMKHSSCLIKGRI